MPDNESTTRMEMKKERKKKVKNPMIGMVWGKYKLVR
jgi:hypothetical protein